MREAADMLLAVRTHDAVEFALLQVAQTAYETEAQVQAQLPLQQRICVQ